MLKKKIIGLLLTGAVVASSYGIVNAKYSNSQNTSIKNVKVLAYKGAPQTINQNGTNYKINKYDNLKSIAWLNNDEVLVLKVKESKKMYPDESFCQYIHSLSIYNLNTGKSKDFEGVNVGAFKGVSPNGKYALYQEPRNIPAFGSDEYKQKAKSGELYHANMKILNLETGEILPFNAVNAPYTNRDDEYFWVDDTKIIDWSFESKKFQISDVNGKVYKESPIKVGTSVDYLVGSDLKVSGDNITGCLYINIHNDESSAIKTLDINTNKLTNVIDNELGLEFKKQNGVILTCSVKNNDERSKDTIRIYNNDYSLKNEINLDDNIVAFENVSYYISNGIVSLDGSKLYYGGHDEKLKVLDLVTGTVNTISSGFPKDLAMNKDGTAISYNDGYSTYIVNLK